MFTSGYDFYAPTECVIYHLYSRAHRPTFQEVQPVNRDKLKAEAQQCVRSMLGISKNNTIDTSILEMHKRYGLG